MLQTVSSNLPLLTPLRTYTPQPPPAQEHTP